MKDWLIALLGALLFAGYGLGMYKWGEWHERVVWTESDFRDTVTVTEVRIDTVYLTKIVVKRIEATVDSTETAPKWYTATADTTVDRTKLHVEYNSPLPLSVRGFFSDFSVQLPPRIDSVRTVYVTVTNTVIETEMDWPWIVAGTGIGIAGGIILWESLQ